MKGTRGKRRAAELTLLEEDDILLPEPKEGLLPEEGLGVLPRRSRGHHKPRDPRLVLPSDLVPRHLLEPLDPLRLVLEQRLARRQSNVKAPLGGGRAQSSSLPAGHEEDGDLGLCDGGETGGAPGGRLCRVGEDRGRAVRGQGLDVVGSVLDREGGCGATDVCGWEGEEAVGLVDGCLDGGRGRERVSVGRRRRWLSSSGRRRLAGERAYEGSDSVDDLGPERLCCLGCLCGCVDGELVDPLGQAL